MDLHAILGFPDRKNRKRISKQRYMEIMEKIVALGEKIVLPDCLCENQMEKFDEKKIFKCEVNETRIFCYLPEYACSTVTAMQEQLIRYNGWDKEDIRTLEVTKYNESVIRIDIVMVKRLRNQMIKEKDFAIKYKESNYPVFDFVDNLLDSSSADMKNQCLLQKINDTDHLKFNLFLEATSIKSINRNLLKRLMGQEFFDRGGDSILRLKLSL